MRYEEFKMELKERVEKSMKTGIKVKLDTIKKNNRSEMEVLTFYESGINMMPAIHLDELYEEYLKDENMKKVVQMILEILETKAHINRKKIIGSWQNVKDLICIKLVNYEWNSQMLQNVPHKKILDLAAVFQVRLCKKSNCVASVLIKEPMLNEWGITAEELWETAMKNLKSEAYTINGIGDVLADIIDVREEIENESCRMYVLGNQELYNGATGILRHDLMEKFSTKIKGDFYILPSSIHEVILVPVNKEICADELKKMVIEVNETQVRRDEQLSNSVYRYNCETGQIEL